jgi:hypothetical protein
MSAWDAATASCCCWNCRFWRSMSFRRKYSVAAAHARPATATQSPIIAIQSSLDWLNTIGYVPGRSRRLRLELLVQPQSPMNASRAVVREDFPAGRGPSDAHVCRNGEKRVIPEQIPNRILNSETPEPRWGEPSYPWWRVTKTLVEPGSTVQERKSPSRMPRAAATDSGIVARRDSELCLLR